MTQVPRVFYDLGNSFENQKDLELSEHDSHHLIHVLRLKTGNKLEIVNIADNSIFLAEIISAKKNIKFRTLEKLEITPENTNISLLFGLCKADKNEWIIEKGTELGVDNFIIWQTERSVSKITSNKIKRLEKIAHSAASQSKRYNLPKILTASSQEELNTHLEKYSDSSNYYCSLESSAPPVRKIQEEKKQICIAVGPEGDFTPNELSYLKSNNFKPISLGSRVLRSETAAIVALSAFRLILT